jgi:hypothetical protein
MTTIRIFRYLDDLDCFVVSDKYRRIADQLGLTEWSPVGWIGRLFTRDNDHPSSVRSLEGGRGIAYNHAPMPALAR